MSDKLFNPDLLNILVEKDSIHLCYGWDSYIEITFERLEELREDVRNHGKS